MIFFIESPKLVGFMETLGTQDPSSWPVLDENPACLVLSKHFKPMGISINGGTQNGWFIVEIPSINDKWMI